MIEITGTAAKRAWLAKTLPPVEKVAPLVWSIPIVFPGNSVRYTFCYVLAAPSGECVVLDPGWETSVGWDQLVNGLAAAGQPLDTVVGILLTHSHADHLGLVHRLTDATGAWVAMLGREGDAVTSRTDAAATHTRERTWLKRCGVPDETVASLLTDEAELNSAAQFAHPTILLAHNDLLPLPGRTLRVLATPGHTVGHICVIDLDSNLIFTGDHVLPRISPNMGLGTLTGIRNTLADYLASLDLMLAWDAFEVCPGHEYRFRGLAARAQALRTHHETRSREVLDVLTTSPNLSVWEIAQRLSWSRGWAGLSGIHLRGALAETVAHLEYLDPDRASLA